MAVLFLAVTDRACAMAATPSPTRPLTELIESFDRDLGRLARRDRVPAAAAAIVHGGELVWEGAAGAADRESGAAAGRDGRDTVFQVASLSKPVTALGVMLLVEEGRLDLDRPIWDYVEGWRLPFADHDARRVTARLLLGHRAGVGVHGYPGYEPDRPLPSLLDSLGGDNGGAGAATLVAEPGTTTLYSSGGYSILQLAIEQITGEPFAGFMQRRVLDPLGMTHSSFEPRDRRRDARAGHGWWGDRLPAYRFREQAASGLYATAGDVGRFLTVLSSPSAQRAVGVSATTIETMLQPRRRILRARFRHRPVGCAHRQRRDRTRPAHRVAQRLQSRFSRRARRSAGLGRRLRGPDQQRSRTGVDRRSVLRVGAVADRPRERDLLGGA